MSPRSAATGKNHDNRGDSLQRAKTRAQALDQLRNRLRVKHDSIRTEQAYVDWVRRFILFHGTRHPRELGPAEVEAFLTDLAVRCRVPLSGSGEGARTDAVSRRP
jgi:hypothetical protein